MDKKQLRIDGYNLLSQLLERPTSDIEHIVKSDSFQDHTLRIKETSGVSIPHSWNHNSIPQLDQWQEMWDQTMGPVRPLASPIESLYKEWTTDPSCEMTIARQKGWLRGDWAYHMEELLGELGFDIPEQFSHCPDHLILIFELMSAMIESDAPADVQKQFADQHMDWLGDLVDTARERKVPAIYVDLYQWCKDFVDADKRYLSEHVQNSN